VDSGSFITQTWREEGSSDCVGWDTSDEVKSISHNYSTRAWKVSNCHYETGLTLRFLVEEEMERRPSS